MLNIINKKGQLESQPLSVEALNAPPTPDDSNFNHQIAPSLAVKF